MATAEVRALLFDVFGTVVDWRSCVIEEAVRAAGTRDVNWGEFADRWRMEGYLEPIREIVAGTRPYADVEVFLRESLIELLGRHSITLGTEELDRLASVWRRLDPWPDAAQGLERLRRHFVIAPLSNGSFALLTSMAKRAALPWDCIVSTELFSTYKPDPAAYLGAARLLRLSPREVMLVAAHPSDLRAAAESGFRTAYVPRPLEWGPAAGPPPQPDPGFDLCTADFVALAEELCPSEGVLGEP